MDILFRKVFDNMVDQVKNWNAVFWRFFESFFNQADNLKKLETELKKEARNLVGACAVLPS